MSLRNQLSLHPKSTSSNEEKYNLDYSNDNGSRLSGTSLLADLLYGADGKDEEGAV